MMTEWHEGETLLYRDFLLHFTTNSYFEENDSVEFKNSDEHVNREKWFNCQIFRIDIHFSGVYLTVILFYLFILYLCTSRVFHGPLHCSSH